MDPSGRVFARKSVSRIVRSRDGKQEGQGLLVVPDVGAVHRAAAALVAAALEAEEALVLEEQAGVRPHDRGLARHRVEDVRRAACSSKSASWNARERASRSRKPGGGVTRHVPGAREPPSVVVPQDLSLHLRLAVPGVLAQRGMPGEQEGDRLGCAGCEAQGRARGSVGGAAVLGRAARGTVREAARRRRTR